MLGSQPLMAFVATTDAAKARSFYEGVLGLTVRAADPYGINFGAGEKYLRVSVIRDFKAPPYAVLSWVVEDITAMVTTLAQKEVLFEKYQGLGQDENGIWTAPDGTKVAWFKDPDQNVLSLTQFKLDNTAR